VVTNLREWEMKSNRFEIQPCHWFKRRLGDKQRLIVFYKVSDFEKIENSKCEIVIRYSGEIEFITLTGRVCCSRVYNVGGGVRSEKWSINGINEVGDFMLLKVLE
jgi:hypothetical protein